MNEDISVCNGKKVRVVDAEEAGFPKNAGKVVLRVVGNSREFICGKRQFGGVPKFFNSVVAAQNFAGKC